MYKPITIFDEPRIVEDRNDTYYEVSETKCIGVMGIPVAYHVRNFENKDVAFVEGIPLSRPVYSEGKKEVKGTFITNPLFMKLVEEKIIKLEDADKIVFSKQYEAR